MSGVAICVWLCTARRRRERLTGPLLHRPPWPPLALKSLPGSLAPIPLGMSSLSSPSLPDSPQSFCLVWASCVPDVCPSKLFSSPPCLCPEHPACPITCTDQRYTPIRARQCTPIPSWPYRVSLATLPHQQLIIPRASLLLFLLKPAFAMKVLSAPPQTRAILPVSPSKTQRISQRPALLSKILFSSLQQISTATPRGLLMQSPRMAIVSPSIRSFFAVIHLHFSLQNRYRYQPEKA